MANSTSLLLQSDSVDLETMMRDQVPVLVTLDEYIEPIFGAFGCMQFIQVLLVSMLVFFDGQQAFINIFTDAEPTWKCTNYDSTIACNSSSDLCDLPKSAWSRDASSSQTIISEWGLECASSIITGLPASSFFTGCFVGGFILALLGDSTLGRKNLLFLPCFAMSITALATNFSPNFWVYSTLRFITGCFRSSILSSALVLLMEGAAKRRRSQVGITAFICFSLGLLSLPAIAYINRGSSWRSLYLWTSIPAICYCIIVYFLVNESPRWLFVHGREAEAIAVLKNVSSVSHDRLHSCLSNMPLVQGKQNVDLHFPFKNLISRRWALRRLLTITALAVVIGMAYYGILLGIGNLNFNIYLSVTFNGVMDMPAYFVTFVLMDRWNRRRSILAFCVLGGLCSMIICVLTSDELKIVQIGFEVASFFSVCVAFNVLLIYTIELFPTTLRNAATSMVRQAINFGAMFGPILSSAGRRNNEFLFFGVLGIVVMCSGLFVICLPETRGMAFCDTLDEQEKENTNSCMT